MPLWLQPYLPIAVVAALDAVFGGFRARLDGIFDAKVFVISFVSNVVVAALIVFLGDQLASARSCPPLSSSCWASASSATPRRSDGTCSGPDRGPTRTGAAPRSRGTTRCRPVGPGRPGEPAPSRRPGRAGPDRRPDQAAEPDEGAEPDTAGRSPSKARATVEADRAAARPAPPAGQERRPRAAAPAARVPGARRRRDPLAAALIAVLTLLLGFAFAVQVRSVGNGQALAGAREEDLVRILDELNAREERLASRSTISAPPSPSSPAPTASRPPRWTRRAGGRKQSASSTAPWPRRARVSHDRPRPRRRVRVDDVLDAIQELREPGRRPCRSTGCASGCRRRSRARPGT